MWGRMMNNINQMVGMHEGRLNSHDEVIKDFKTEFKVVNDKLDGIQDTLNQKTGEHSMIKKIMGFGKWIVGLFVAFKTGQGIH